MNAAARKTLEEVADHLIDYERSQRDCGPTWQGPSLRKIAEFGARILGALKKADEPDELCPCCGKPLSDGGHTISDPQPYQPRIVACPTIPAGVAYMGYGYPLGARSRG